jgi:hypothetical protein
MKKYQNPVCDPCSPSPSTDPTRSTPTVAPSRPLTCWEGFRARLVSLNVYCHRRRLVAPCRNGSSMATL